MIWLLNLFLIVVCSFLFLNCREVYHTKRMQHVICIKWSADNRYILSGSDEMNIRLWKANAAEKLGVVSPASFLLSPASSASVDLPFKNACCLLVSRKCWPVCQWAAVFSSALRRTDAISLSTLFPDRVLCVGFILWLGQAKSRWLCQQLLLPDALMKADWGWTHRLATGVPWMGKIRCSCLTNHQQKDFSRPCLVRVYVDNVVSSKVFRTNRHPYNQNEIHSWLLLFF